MSTSKPRGSDPNLRPLSLASTPPMTWSEWLRASGKRMVRGCLLGFAVFAGIYALTHVGQDAVWHWQDFIGQGVTGGAIFGLLSILLYSLRKSRHQMDRLFRHFALGATCLSLIFLAFFFFGLTRDTIRWFQVTPTAIQEAYDKEKQEIDELLVTRKRELERERDLEIASADSEEEKKEIREEYDQDLIPKRMKEAIQIAATRQAQLEKGQRQDTSPWGLLKHFLTHGPSDNSRPQDAGILPAILGSFLIGIITILVALPLGVGAAIYLEEYRHKGWLNRIIQVNITNLAAVPSVFYGILGAYLFVELTFKQLQGEMWTPGPLIWFFGDDRAKAFMHFVFGERIAARNLLGGGLSLGLLTLPMVIVSSQEAIRAVPVSLRHGALALGATKWQSIWHIVLPQARGGILTGVILALSRALGEAAPLVMFGALTLVTYNPGLLTPFTVMPLQIFNWAERSDKLFLYNAGVASMILMMLLLSLNGVAIYLRQKARKSMVGH